MSEEIKKGVDEMKSLVEGFQKENDARLNEIESKKHADPLLEEKVTRMNDEITKRLETLETAHNREAESHNEEDETKELTKKAFDHYMKVGKDGLSLEEQKALAVYSDPAGGYLVQPEMSMDIEKRVFESSPVRQLASVVSISSDRFKEPADWQNIGASWAHEIGSRSETTAPSFSELEIGVHECYAHIYVTQSMLDDSGINVEQYVRDAAVERFARLEATAFVSGTGVLQPRGFTTYTAESGTDTYGLIEQVNSGSDGAFTADGLIDLQNALYEPFQANASWLMARASAADCRQLKDGDGRYLWSFDGGLNMGPREMLLGKPIYHASDMPAVASAALAAAYGDFRRGYLIVDRIGIRMLRDPYVNKPYVTFYMTKRVGGGVRNYQAIKLQVLSS